MESGSAFTEVIFLWILEDGNREKHQWVDIVKEKT